MRPQLSLGSTVVQRSMRLSRATSIAAEKRHDMLEHRRVQRRGRRRSRSGGRSRHATARFQRRRSPGSVSHTDRRLRSERERSVSARKPDDRQIDDIDARTCVWPRSRRLRAQSGRPCAARDGASSSRGSERQRTHARLLRQSVQRGAAAHGSRFRLRSRAGARTPGLRAALELGLQRLGPRRPEEAEAHRARAWSRRHGAAGAPGRSASYRRDRGR